MATTAGSTVTSLSGSGSGYPPAQGMSAPSDLGGDAEGLDASPGLGALFQNYGSNGPAPLPSLPGGAPPPPPPSDQPPPPPPLGA